MPQPRTKQQIENELRTLLKSKDSKVTGLLKAWCIFTVFWIILGVSTNINEFSVWLQAIFIFVLLMMAVKGRCRLYIIIISAFFSVMLFLNVAGTTGRSLRTNCAFSDWSNASRCYAVSDDVWENRAKISRISGIIVGSYYAITTLCVWLPKSSRKHFAWGKKQAKLWRELNEKSKTKSLKSSNNSEDSDDNL